MAMEECSRCGRSFEESELLFTGRGKICETCEVDQQEARAVSRGLWTTILSGPLTAAAATLMLCVPVAGPFLVLAFGAMALWRGTVALQVLWYARNDDAVGSFEKGALGVSGTITAMWSILLVMGGGIGAVLAVWRIFTTPLV
jgi:hypothetical protein